MNLSLNVQILIGTIAGILGGLALSFLSPSSVFYASVIYVCDILAGLFVNLLKMILIPLIFTSVAAGIANLSTHRQIKKVWTYTLIYFGFSSMVAATLGLTAMNVFKPGFGLHIFSASPELKATQMTLAQFIQSFLSGLFVNPVSAMAQGNILATVVFAFFMGAALIAFRERTTTLFRLLNEIVDIIMLMVQWIMRLAPWGIMALLIKLMATADFALFRAMGTFMAVVLGSTMIHGFIILPAVLYWLTKKTPLFFFKGFYEALITAFTTSSSNVTLPVSIRCAREKLNIDQEISGFVFPLGATVNMDGTALYEAAAALFVANVVGVHLNLVQQIIVVLMAVVASIGAPGIPSAGMVTMLMVLQAVGLPIEAISLLLPIDRFLDTFRTMVNVEGDAVCSLIVQHLVKENP